MGPGRSLQVKVEKLPNLWKRLAGQGLLLVYPSQYNLQGITPWATAILAMSQHRWHRMTCQLVKSVKSILVTKQLPV